MKYIEVWIIRDPNGNVWQTPKGKSSWAGAGFAKNAWAYHQHPGVNCTWTKDAEPNGWTVELLSKYELVKV